MTFHGAFGKRQNTWKICGQMFNNSWMVHRVYSSFMCVLKIQSQCVALLLMVFNFIHYDGN